MTDPPDALLSMTPEANIAEVWDTMRELEVRHVPVVQRGAPVGMLSDRDLARIDVACWKSRFSFINAAGLP
jgi:CBS domain-containing protein